MIEPKFTDEQLLELYNKGLSDRAIAKELKVATFPVWSRRMKLHLTSNHYFTRQGNLTLEQTYDRRKQVVEHYFKFLKHIQAWRKTPEGKAYRRRFRV